MDILKDIIRDIAQIKKRLGITELKETPILTVQEQDASPSVVNVNKIKVTNGTLTDNGGGVVSLAIGSGSGTVTSVALTAPTAEFDVTGSPVTTSGTLALAWDNQSANLVFAGPASGSAATPSFRSLVIADLLSILQTGAAGVIFEHFLNIPPGSAQGDSGLGLTTNASGSSAIVATVAPPDAASLGVIDLTSGTATNGRAGVFSYNASPGISIQFGGGTLDLSWRFQVVTLPTGTDDFDLTIGFIDAVNSSHTDGVYLFLSSASANFRYFTRSNGAGNTTNTDSGLAAVAGTWYVLRIVVNAAASSVTFTIDGGSSQSVGTNIPTGAGREVGIGAGITKTAGTNSRHAYIDYARFAWSGVSA